jgi:hypothetical protein
LIVLGQDIRLDLHHARLTEAGSVGVRRPLSIIVRVIWRRHLTVLMVMAALVHLVIPTAVSVIVIKRMIAPRTLPVDPGFALTASANRAHRSISALAPGDLPTRRAAGAGFPHLDHRIGKDGGRRCSGAPARIADWRHPTSGNPATRQLLMIHDTRSRPSTQDTRSSRAPEGADSRRSRWFQVRFSFTG